MDDLKRLFDAYAENDLSDEDRQALCAWLQESEANRDRFVRESFLHSQLFDVLRQQDLQDDIIAAEPPVDTRALLASVVDSGAPRRPARRRRVWLAVAASALVVASALWGVSNFWPSTVAQVTKVSPAVAWEPGADAPRVGALLRAGDRLRLRSGRVFATLVSGASFVLEGPAEVRIDGDNQLWLQSGSLGVDVPTQATGLVVNSPLARFTDLGTAFTIHMAPDDGCEIFVFAGMVEMTPTDRGPVRVSLGSAVSYDADAGDVESLPYDEGQKLEL